MKLDLNFLIGFNGSIREANELILYPFGETIVLVKLDLFRILAYYNIKCVYNISTLQEEKIAKNTLSGPGWRFFYKVILLTNLGEEEFFVKSTFKLK